MLFVLQSLKGNLQKPCVEGGNGSVLLPSQFFSRLCAYFSGGLKPEPAVGPHGSSVKQVSFYDDDVCFWQLWRNRSAAAEAPTAANHIASTFSSPAPSTKGRHFLVICCENKAIFLDLVTMRGRDVPKQDLDGRSLLWQVPLVDDIK